MFIVPDMQKHKNSLKLWASSMDTLELAQPQTCAPE